MSSRAFATSAQAAKKATWWARTRDAPETYLLYGAVLGTLGMGFYAMKRVLFNNDAGSYTNINIRGNPERQVENARSGWEDPARGKHSLFWHVAQVKVDKDGQANLSVLPWDNKARPHQYSKPGIAGIGAGRNVEAGAGTPM